MLKLSKENRYLIFLIIGGICFVMAGTIFLPIGFLPYRIGTGNDIKSFLSDFTNFSLGEVGIMPFKTLNYLKYSYNLLQFISYLPLLVIIAWFFVGEYADDIMDFKQNIRRNIIIIIIGIVSMYILNYNVNNIYAVIGVEGQSNNEGIINSLLLGPGKWFMIISVVFIAPITEEFVFRKLIFGTIEKKFKWHFVVSIIVSCLIFSFIHVSDLASLKFIFQYIALALPICLCYHFSGNNIVTSTLIHMFNNGVSVLATYLLMNLE